jgi:hypothetical protein
MYRIKPLRPLFVAALLATSLISTSVAGASAATTSVKACGTVTAFVAPTALLDGSVTVGGVPIVIASGATINGQLDSGADACVTATVDSSLRATTINVTADTTTTLALCGVVTDFEAATPASTGRLVIGTRSLILAAGANLPSDVRVGSDLCLNLALNGLAQVTGGKASLNATSTIKVCGVVSAVTTATATQTGRLIIGSRSLVVAAGTDLPATIKAAANLCATITLNSLGQVQGATATANVAAAASVAPAGAGAPHGGAEAEAEAAPQIGAAARVLGESLTQPEPGSGDDSASPGGSGGSPDGGEGRHAPASANGEGAGALPNTASFARVLDLAARTALPISVLGVILFAVAGVATIRQRIAGAEQ